MTTKLSTILLTSPQFGLQIGLASTTGPQGKSLPLPAARREPSLVVEASRTVVQTTALLVILLVITICPLCLLCPIVQAVDPTVLRLESKKIPEFDPPDVSIHTFKNGLKLYYLENKELPVFELKALIEVGSIDEPTSKKGITGFMMSGMRTGGSTQESGDKIDAKLEQVAADLSVHVGGEYSTMKITSLVDDADLSLDIFFDLLKTPKFEEKKMEIIRQQIFEGIRRRNEDPMEIASREFNQLNYGEESVWARLPTRETVQSIMHDDINDYHHQYIVPNNIWIAVSGYLSFEDLISKIEKRIQGWQPKAVKRFEREPVIKKWGKDIQIINKKINQSSVMMGHFGEKRFNPDKYALIVANFVLGGSTFGSRLGTKIRTTLGLAYSVSSFFGFETDYGLFYIAASTKSESTVDLIEETKKIVHDMISIETVTEEEVDFAKQTILNQLILQYDDPFQIVSSRLYYDFYNYPPDYLKVYQRELNKVTVQDVERVLEEYIRPESFKILIVGNKEQIKNLSALGKVTMRPLDEE